MSASTDRDSRLPDNAALRLRDVEVLDTNGAAVRLGSLWQEAPAVVVFVRHYG